MPVRMDGEKTLFLGLMDSQLDDLRKGMIVYFEPEDYELGDFLKLNVVFTCAQKADVIRAMIGRQEPS